MNQNETPEQLKQQIAELTKENTALKRKTKYGLNWEDKPEMLDNKDVIPLFKKNEELSLPHIDNQPENYLIEGDNYHSLKVLQHTHREKVDVIYIDPPYNTGNTDFVYNDKYVDSDDGFRHSKWLSFMDKRLRLARELMKKDGVIFVSIDDNEVAQLKLLMDKIFGEENFIANMIIENNPKGRKNSKHISYTHEYLLVYARSYKSPKFNLTVEKQDSRKNQTDHAGAYKQGKRVLVGMSSNKETTNVMSEKNYDVFYDFQSDNMVIAKRRDGALESAKINLLPQGYRHYKNLNSNSGRPSDATYTADYLMRKHANGDLIFKDSTIYEKDRELNSRAKSIWTKDTMSGVDMLNETAGKKLAEIIGDSQFSFPKNINLIKEVLKLHPNKSATVLDFFAGSGTTGHAVMELNAEDGGKRSFILCTNNEVSPEQERNYLANNTDF